MERKIPISEGDCFNFSKPLDNIRSQDQIGLQGLQIKRVCNLQASLGPLSTLNAERRQRRQSQLRSWQLLTLRAGVSAHKYGSQEPDSSDLTMPLA